MTTAQMLARCRTLLDESTAAFWTDAEIYSALADGQQEAANYFLTLYKTKIERDPNVPLPQVLESLYIAVTSTTATAGITKPSAYWHLVSARYAYTGGLMGTFYNCRIERISPAVNFNLENTYLTASSTSPTIYEAYSGGLQFWFSPSPSGDAGYTINYLKVPTAISVSQEPTLPVQTHSAIVHWAVSQMLLKEKSQEAQLFSQLFLTELQTIG